MLHVVLNLNKFCRTRHSPQFHYNFYCGLFLFLGVGTQSGQESFLYKVLVSGITFERQLSRALRCCQTNHPGQHQQAQPTCWNILHTQLTYSSLLKSLSTFWDDCNASSYLSNHVQLNKINNRAHNSYTAGLAATVQLSVRLTTGVIRTSLQYQGITLKQPCSLCWRGLAAVTHSAGGGGCKLITTISVAFGHSPVTSLFCFAD